MQKIFRINLLARNQALRATRRKNLEKAKQEWAEHDQRQIAREKAIRGFVKAERRHRREDWIAGPLAPKRDVGEKEKLYGTVDGVLVQGPSFPERARLGPKGNGWDPVGSEGLESEQKEWEGEGNEGNIVVGDRVCVIRGHENIVGRIGTVTDISGERKELTVDGINMVRLDILPLQAAYLSPSFRLNLTRRPLRPTWSCLLGPTSGNESLSKAPNYPYLSPPFGSSTASKMRRPVASVM